LRTLKQLLEARYPAGCYALNKHEAILLGIQYPLKAGWIRAYGNMVLTEAQEENLALLNTMKRKQARKTARELTRKERRKQQPVLSSPTYQKTFQASKEFLQTYEWRKVRMEALKKYGARCAACGATAMDGVRLHVDHIRPRALYPALALTLENLQILCEECNHGKGNWDITDWRVEESHD
jgi:5-methylcytosine-specific restriction endonuclease McrA